MGRLDEGRTAQDGSRACFLCRPREDWVYLEAADLFCMVGIGQLMEGYSLIATRDHIPSMFDLPESMVERCGTFRQEVRATILRVLRQRCIITEHGRVPICDYYDRTANETHCYHAHHLVFPGDVELRPYLERNAFNVTRFGSFAQAWRARIAGEYLYYEDMEGGVTVATARPRLPRQFFRMLVAEQLGLPERANWRTCSRDEQQLTRTAKRLRENDA
jgi:hypothetical protein